MRIIKIAGLILLFGIVVHHFVTYKGPIQYPNPNQYGNDESQYPIDNNSEGFTRNEYKYNSRTEGTDGYEYNYDVSGSDDNGDGVSGNIDMHGKYGSGYIENYDGEEIEVEAEWVDYGEIEAYDQDGNYYELEVE